MFCTACNKKLRAFTTTKDWASRPMHKTCWLRQKEEEVMKRMMEDFEIVKNHVRNHIADAVSDTNEK